MGNEELSTRSNAIISELETQRSMMSVRATHLASELAMQTQRANMADAKICELQNQVSELQSQINASNQDAPVAA